ncbi:MAG TPA: FixH family protein [Gemmatimonadales bacterium]|nr:FixH family protein [Gemmatimonadales bacterium]
MRSSNRSPLAALAVAVTVTLVTGCMMFIRPPADSEFGRTRVGMTGIYRATITPAGDTIPQGVLQQWTLHVETVAGTPVDSATVSIDGGMPQHGHGLPTKPLVTTILGNGNHLVEGLKFNMGGWWVVKFHITAAAGADTVVFNLKL